MPNTEHAIVIAGAGPTGLMLAGELALAQVDVAIVERRASQDVAGSRAGGLHARTIEVLDQRGIADRFLSRGKIMQVAGFAMVPLDISDFPTRHNYGLALKQEGIERALATWVEGLKVPIYRGLDVTHVAQDGTGVDVALSDGRSLRARYVVGCDGGRSVVRKAAGIEFPGWEPSLSYLIAEMSMTEEPVLGMRPDERGVNGLGRMEDGKRVRAVLNERQVKQGYEPTLDELREALVAVYGTDFGVHDVTYLSRFTDAARQAASYRERRVLVAGDAAHVHSPAGGQGLNLGVQDAVNLGWKLAQVVNGTSPESLLDTFHTERHPIGARVLENTLAQTAAMRGDDRTKALHDRVTELLKMDEPRKRFAGMMSGLDIHYDLGAGHPLLGRRMPDLDVVTTDGPQRVYSFLHRARAVLLNLGKPEALDITPWAERVLRVDARYAGAWELPVLGVVAAPAAVLIRPDGYVAWVGDGTDHGLHDALTSWCGQGTGSGSRERFGTVHEALEVTATLAGIAPPALHPTGFPLGAASGSCADCAWRGLSGDRVVCQQFEDVVVDAWPACEHYEPVLDCQDCGACCREAFHMVRVDADDPAIQRLPLLVVVDGDRFELRRDGDRCAALAGGQGERYRCTVYADRPTTCRDFTSGTSSCLLARQRVGMSR